MTRLCSLSFLLTVGLGMLASAQSVQGPKDALDFHNVNVCPGKQTTPKPCSRISTLTYNVLERTTFGATQVVTQGVTNLDFNLTSTTCMDTLAPGSACTVVVTFSPRAPGLRMGAVILNDPSGNLLASTYVFGNGQGPVATFTPSMQKNVPVSNYSGGPIVADAEGNLYFPLNSPTSSGIAKFDIKNSTQTTVASSPITYVIGLAVDGAGNLFVSNNGVVKIAANTGTQIRVGQSLNATDGVAVDGRGNLYVGDDWDTGPSDGLPLFPRLEEVMAASSNQETLLGGGFFGIPFCDYPWGTAVDARGNAYVACINYGPVFESLAGTPPENGGGIIASRQFTTVGNFSGPTWIQVDAAGDVFVDDWFFGGIYEVPAGTSDLISLVIGPSIVPIALNAAGDVFYQNAETGTEVLEMKRSVPAMLGFARVAIGNVSNPQSITIQNVGNQSLNAVAPGISIGAGFQQVPGSGTPPDCTTTFSLTPGGMCNLSIVFAPTSVGKIISNATITDNALNTLPSITQTIRLTGTGVQ